MKKFEFYNIQLEWKPQDLWIGLFWRRTGGTIDAWVCVVPMLPIHISWRWAQQHKSDSTEIKACPFCGQPGIVQKGRRHSNGEWVQLPWVWCKPCGVIKHADTDEEALVRWNTRAGDR